jgi:lamin B
LTETRSHKQVEISEIDGRLAQQYEAKLQQSLQELREQQEAHVRMNREELESRYDSKVCIWKFLDSIIAVTIFCETS